MHVANVVFDFLFVGQLTGVTRWRMRNLCEHMYVAKVAFDFLFFGQLARPKNKKAKPL